MVDEVGRDRDRAEMEWRAVDQVPRGREVGAGSGEERGLAEHALSRFPEIPGHRGVHLADEAVVVRVAVRDDEPDEGRVAGGEPRDRGKRLRVTQRAVEGQPGVEHQASPVVLDLDTAATDLMRAAVDADAHGVFT